MSGPFLDFYVDYQRCIGCNACSAACAECHTHRGTPMVHVDHTEPGLSAATAPMICMHCADPTCASVCPADAIKVDENGIVHASLKPRCIACGNCELSCPFGVPMVKTGISQMLKCDMCFDRTSEGKKPMCATVCPSGALFYGTREDIRERRPNAKPINKWRFGAQEIQTRVHVLVPHDVDVMQVDIPAVDDTGPAGLAMALAGGPRPAATAPNEEAEFL